MSRINPFGLLVVHQEQLRDIDRDTINRLERLSRSMAAAFDDDPITEAARERARRAREHDDAHDREH